MLPEHDPRILLDAALRVPGELVRARSSTSCHALVHAASGRSIDLGPDAWRLVRAFREPTTPRAVAALLGLGDADLGDLADAIARLVEAGALEPEHADVPHRNPGLPSRSRALVPTDDPFLHAFTDADAADVHVIGVPFDRGATHSGCSGGPATIRKASLKVPCYPDPFEAASRGVLDRADGRILMRGARLRDHGDLSMDHWLSLDEAYMVIREGIAELRRHADGVLVVLGGDHSITVPVVQAFEEQPLYVVHLDAHGDLGVVDPDAPHHHGSFATALAALPHVRGILQLGVRDFVEPWRAAPSNIEQIGSRTLRKLAPRDVIARIPADARCYVTIDIDVLDPCVAPGTGIPVPGGPDLYAIEELLEELGRQRDVVALDVVEVDPTRDVGIQTSLVATRLLVRMLDAIVGRRHAC